jgi:hypothetical protein
MKSYNEQADSRNSFVLRFGGQSGGRDGKAHQADKIAIYGRRCGGRLSEGLILLTYTEHMI